MTKEEIIKITPSELFDKAVEYAEEKSKQVESK